MQVFKKLTSLALALTLMLFMGVVTAFAADPATEVEVGTIADFKAALANPAIIKITITTDLVAEGTDAVGTSRSLTIEGGGNTINNALYFGGDGDTTITVNNLKVVATNPSTNRTPIIYAGVMAQHTGNLILNNCDISATENASTGSDRTRVYGLFTENVKVTAARTKFAATAGGASSDMFTYGAFIRPAAAGQGLSATGCTFGGEIGVGIQEENDAFAVENFELANNSYTGTSLAVYLVDNNSVGIDDAGFGLENTSDPMVPRVPSDAWLLGLLNKGHKVCLANADETLLERYTRTAREYRAAVSGMADVIGGTGWTSEAITLPATPAPPTTDSTTSPSDNAANSPATADKIESTVDAVADIGSVDLASPDAKLPAGIKVETTATGSKVAAVPVGLYAGSADLDMDVINTIGSNDKVALNLSVSTGISGSTLKILLPGGFGKITEPGRIGYSFDYKVKADDDEKMLKAVKTEGATSVTAKIGGNHTLPVKATFTVSTKVANGKTVNIYKYDATINKYSSIGSAKVEAGKLVFSTAEMGQMLFTTGTI